MSIVDLAKISPLFRACGGRAREPICLFIGFVRQGCNGKGSAVYFQIGEQGAVHCFNYTLRNEESSPAFGGESLVNAWRMGLCGRRPRMGHDGESARRHSFIRDRNSWMELCRVKS